MISTERCFHVLLAATFVAATLAGNVDQWLQLGEHERAASAILGMKPFTIPAISDWVVFLVAGIFILAVTATFIGLVKFQRWSRVAALVVTVLMVGMKAVGAASIVSGPSIALSGVTFICWGVAIAMTYFSPLAERFENNSSRLTWRKLFSL